MGGKRFLEQRLGREPVEGVSDAFGIAIHRRKIEHAGRPRKIAGAEGRCALGCGEGAGKISRHFARVGERVIGSDRRAARGEFPFDGVEEVGRSRQLGGRRADQELVGELGGEFASAPYRRGEGVGLGDKNGADVDKGQLGAPQERAGPAHTVVGRMGREGGRRMKKCCTSGSREEAIGFFCEGGGVGIPVGERDFRAQQGDPIGRERTRGREGIDEGAILGDFGGLEGEIDEVAGEEAERCAVDERLGKFGVANGQFGSKFEVFAEPFRALAVSAGAHLLLAGAEAGPRGVEGRPLGGEVATGATEAGPRGEDRHSARFGCVCESFGEFRRTAERFDGAA